MGLDTYLELSWYL